MNKLYQKIILCFLLTSAQAIITAESSPNLWNLKKYAISIFAATFLIGYWGGTITFKKIYSQPSTKNTSQTLALPSPITNDDTPKPENDVQKRVEEFEKKWEKEVEKNNQLKSENIRVEEENIKLKIKIKTMRECIKKLFPLSLSKGSYAAIRLKSYNNSNHTLNDDKQALEPIAKDFLETFELQDDFKTMYNQSTKSWLFERI